MHILLGFVLATFAASPAYSATLSFADAWGTITAFDEDLNFIGAESDFASHHDTVTEGRSVSARASLQSAGVDHSASGAADIRIGSFSLAAEKGAGYGEVIGGSSTVQEFTARGNGQVTMRMDLSGWWDTGIPDPAVYSRFFVYSVISVETPQFDNSFFGVDTLDPGFQSSGQISHSLSYTALVADGLTYTFNGAMEAVFDGAMTGSVALDGALSYSVTDGVRLEFADPAFLTAAIPLPAGWLLLVGALGVGFGLPAAKRAALAGLLRRNMPR